MVSISDTDMERDYHLEKLRLKLIDLIVEKQNCELEVAKGLAAKKRLVELNGGWFSPGEIQEVLFEIKVFKNSVIRGGKLCITNK